MSSRKLQLSDVCEISMGQAPAGETYNTVGKGHPLIAGAGDFGEVTPKATKFTTAPTKVSRAGDIILCIRATIGDRNWADGEYCLGRGVAGLAARSEKLHQRFLWHWLGYAEPALRAKGRGATFLQVSKADIGSMEIPVPPLQDQRRIAAILDKADELRAKRREAIAKIDQLLRSVFLDMFGDPAENRFGWPVFDLGELLRDGPQNGIYKPAQDYGSGTPILRIDGYRAGDVIRTLPRKRVRLSAFEVMKYGLKPLDIVVNRVNSPEHLGKPALIQDVPEPTVFESNMMRMSIRDDVAVPEYVITYLVQGFVRSQIAKIRKDAINQSSINQDDVKSLRINIPPLTLQERFRSIRSQLFRQRDASFLSTSSLETLFASLQHRAFSGTL